MRTEHGARGQTDGETVKELEAALEEAIARRDEASNRCSKGKLMVVSLSCLLYS